MRKRRPMNQVSQTQYVRLNQEERASHETKVERWIETLKRQAADDSDPETQANARALLKSRRKEADDAH
jgi:hypothetical protein